MELREEVAYKFETEEEFNFLNKWFEDQGFINDSKMKYLEYMEYKEPALIDGKQVEIIRPNNLFSFENWGADEYDFGFCHEDYYRDKEFQIVHTKSLMLENQKFANLQIEILKQHELEENTSVISVESLNGKKVFSVSNDFLKLIK